MLGNISLRPKLVRWLLLAALGPIGVLCSLVLIWILQVEAEPIVSWIIGLIPSLLLFYTLHNLIPEENR